MKLKKYLAALACALLPALAVRAEGASSGMDTSGVESMLGAIQNGLTTLLTNCMPVITAIVLAGLALWAGLVVVRIVKKVFARAA